MKVTGIETLTCDAGWRNYHFVKLTTDSGIVGWSEFDEGFGSPGVGAVIAHLTPRVVGQPVGEHERIYADLYCATRPGAGSVISQGMGAIENALLDAKAKALGISFEEQRRISLERVSMHKMVSPYDIANLALYLASDAGKHITGQALSVCAGVEMLG